MIIGDIIITPENGEFLNNCGGMAHERLGRKAQISQGHEPLMPQKPLAHERGQEEKR